MAAYDSSYPASCMRGILRGKVHPFTSYPDDDRVTAADAPTAAALAGYGYHPAFTRPWQTGEQFVIGTGPSFLFHWNGTTWAPGPMPALRTARARAGEWPDTDELDAMTKAELIDTASDRGVEVDRYGTKAEIRAVIAAAVTAPPAPTPAPAPPTPPDDDDDAPPAATAAARGGGGDG